MNQPRRLLLLPFLTLLMACNRGDGDTARPGPAQTAASVAVTAPPPASTAPVASASTSASASAGVPGAGAPLSDRELGALITAISEEGGKFPSDNYVSNETSYLHVMKELAGHRGGAYIGVGPEQNFTYLALLEPQLSFIVDIRRDNLVVHLLYKVLFERAATRGEFLAALTSRQAPTLAADATIEQIVEAVKQARHDPALESTTRQQVTERAAALGLTLTADDRKHLREALAAFGKQGLGIHYTMEGSARSYPSLGELAAVRDDDKQQSSFLGTDAAYQKVRRLQMANRVVPVVGDLAGDGALPRMAAELKKRQLTLNVLYTSNVEQYVFPPPAWGKWVRNVRAMPWASDGVLLRVYFDQGKAHPLQRAGHRTTSMVRPARAFLDRADKGGWKSWWEVATE